MRDPNTKRTSVLRWLAMTNLGSWDTGYLGVCPLTGRAMFLTERAARRAAIVATLDALGIDAAEVAEVIDAAVGSVTGRTDGAHAPVAKANGGTRIVLTDADAQQAVGDADTLGTDDAPSIDTAAMPKAPTVAKASTEVTEARRRLR